MKIQRILLIALFAGSVFAGSVWAEQGSGPGGMDIPNQVRDQPVSAKKQAANNAANSAAQMGTMKAATTRTGAKIVAAGGAAGTLAAHVPGLFARNKK